MSKIMSCIEGYMTGNAWENLCVQCYRLRYQCYHYTSVPALQGGDAGIEGFTHNGIVHQCYCPEREYSDNDLYVHQRDKLTIDIEKLMKNAARLKDLGVPPIVEWHLDIPEYKDSRILAHAVSKQKEVEKAKKDTPAAFTHIADKFRIIIKTAEDFTPEISRIISTTLTDMKLNLAVQHIENPDWSRCDSQKVTSIHRKIKAVMLINNDNDQDLNDVVNSYVSFYISGMEIMTRLRVDFPEIYEDLYKLEQSYKNEVSIKTRMQTNRAMNHTLFNVILNEFQTKLEKDFSRMLTAASIGELKHDMIASWLADCSMEFRNV